MRNYIGRLTWQASPRNKISFMNSEQYSSSNRTGGGSATRTPEAQGLNLYTPGHTRTLTWSSPFTNKMLLEAGWGSYMANYANDAPRIDGLHNPALISVLEQTGVASAASPVPCSTAAFRPSPTGSTIRSAEGSSIIRSARWPTSRRRSRTSPARTT